MALLVGLSDCFTESLGVLNAAETPFFKVIITSGFEAVTLNSLYLYQFL